MRNAHTRSGALCAIFIAKRISFVIFSICALSAPKWTHGRRCVVARSPLRAPQSPSRIVCGCRETFASRAARARSDMVRYLITYFDAAVANRQRKAR